MDVASDRIRLARQARGWTQQQLAEIADLSLRTVQRVENQAAASNETISSLCAVLELSREEILVGDPKDPAYQKASKDMRLLLSLAAVVGGLLGSGATFWLMQLAANGG